MYKLTEEQDRILYTDAEESRSAYLPKKNCIGIFETGNPEAVRAEDIRKLVTEPVGKSRKLSEIAREKNAKTACIIISDATRGVPTDRVAPYLMEELAAGGIPAEKVVFVVALGVHRDADEGEMRSFLGELYGKVRIENHDAFSEEKLVFLGETSRHTPVRVNRTVRESDLVVTVGKVELHDMAGFSGGRKSILPGVASEETIVINHRPEMMVDPASYAGNLEGNPIHLDMVETARMCGVDYSVNIVMNQAYEIAGIFSGDLEESHEAAAEFLKSFCRVELPERPDIIVTCPGQPLSINMYQGVKALFAFHRLADSGTTVILYGDFWEGVNSTDFIEPFRRYPDLEELKDYVWANYEIQMDHIIPIREMLVKGVRVIVVSEHVSREEIEAFHMEKAETLQEALDRALAECPSEIPRAAFCPQSYRCIWSVKE